MACTKRSPQRAAYCPRCGCIHRRRPAYAGWHRAISHRAQSVPTAPTSGYAPVRRYAWPARTVRLGCPFRAIQASRALSAACVVRMVCPFRAIRAVGAFGAVGAVGAVRPAREVRPE
jgi:hypothetical protein